MNKLDYNVTSPTCDLDVHGGPVVSRHVLCLHGDFVNPRLFVAMLDGFICHRQVLVNGPKAVAEVHLVLGAAGVSLRRRRREDDAQVSEGG